MLRRYALALGSLAFAVVTLRGAYRGESVSEVVTEAILMLVVFAIGGAIATGILEHLAKLEIESRCPGRIAQHRG